MTELRSLDKKNKCRTKNFIQKRNASISPLVTHTRALLIEKPNLLLLLVVFVL